jgi:hypothetical protein
MWKLGIENSKTLTKCHTNPLKNSAKNLKP